MGRTDKNGKKSFRFILNHSKAIVANSYLILYPKPELARAIAERPEMVTVFFETLNGIAEKVMVVERRIYGGGMHKLEPRELGNVPSSELLRSITTGI
jgi:adenine-specific DNA-methyltransferase